MDNLIDEEILSEDVMIVAEEETIGEGENAKKQLCFKGVFSEADSVNINKRVYPKSVLRAVFEEAISRSKKTGKPIFGELEHACFTYDTFKVLTKNGYKPFTELKEGEEVLTFGKDYVEEYKPIEKIISDDYEGIVYHVKGRNIDTTITPNHKFFLKDRNGKTVIATIEEIANDRTKFSHMSIIKNGGIWNGNDKTTVTIKGNEKQPEDLVLDAKDFFAFMGIYLSEGCALLTENNRIISITQKKPENIIKIRELLNRTNFKFSECITEDCCGIETVQFYISDSRIKDYLKPLGRSWEKYIPTELKEYNSEYLNEMLEWFILGDGRDRREEEYSKYVNIFSVSKKLIEDFNEILVKCGISGNITEKPVIKDHLITNREGSKRLIEAKNCRTLYQLNLSTTNGISLDKRFLSIEKENYKGKIYCISVKDNHNFYIEDKNKFFLTGNSDAHVNLERIAVKFPELTWDEETGQIRGKAVPAGPMKASVITLAEDGFPICFSTRMSGKVKPLTEERRRQLNITEEGIVEVCEGARLISIDVVGNQSCQKAVSSTVYEEALNEEVKKPTFKSVFDALI